MTSTSTTEQRGPGRCECCEAEDAVGVAAIPGVPMSIAWGTKCLNAGATPLWIADVNVGMCCNPATPSWSDMADWFREQTVYLDGQYVRVDTLTLRTYECDHGEECPICFEGRTVGIEEYRRGPQQ